MSRSLPVLRSLYNQVDRFYRTMAAQTLLEIETEIMQDRLRRIDAALSVSDEQTLRRLLHEFVEDPCRIVPLELPHTCQDQEEGDVQTPMNLSRRNEVLELAEQVRAKIGTTIETRPQEESAA